MPGLAQKPKTEKQTRAFKFEMREEIQESVNAAGIKVATFKGYASVFDNIDAYDSTIKKGAFAKTLAEHPTFPILAQHDHRRPMGVTAVLREDDHGLWMEAELNLETKDGQEYRSLLKQGAINGLSIGFTIEQFSYDETTEIMTIREVRLWEVSVVTFQANPLASVTDVRGMDDAQMMATLRVTRLQETVAELDQKFSRSIRSGNYEKAAALIDGALHDLTALRGFINAAAGEPPRPAESHLRGMIEELNQAAASLRGNSE